MDFVIVFTISSLVMYVLDGIIAFFIPAKRVEKRLKDEKTAKEITELYGRTLYENIRPQIREDADKLFKEFRLSIRNDVDTGIGDIKNTVTNVINNDIPHIIDTRINELKEQLRNTEVAMYRQMGARGPDARKQKEEEDLYLLNTIKEVAPDKYEMARMMYTAAKFGAITKAEWRKGVSGIMAISGKDGEKGAGVMSVLSGSLPQVQAGTQTVRPEVATGEKTTQESSQSTGNLTDAQALKQLKAAAKDSGMEVPLALAIEKGEKHKENLAGGDVNGKKEKE